LAHVRFNIDQGTGISLSRCKTFCSRSHFVTWVVWSYIDQH